MVTDSPDMGRPRPARPFAPGHAPTSAEAYEKVLKRLTETLWRLYLWIEAAGADGMNCAELCEASDGVAQTISRRITDMKYLGMVAYRRDAHGSLVKRLGHRGTSQLVLVAIPVGQWIPTDETSTEAKIAALQGVLKWTEGRLAFMAEHLKGGAQEYAQATLDVVKRANV
jgi:hypothetical protein